MPLAVSESEIPENRKNVRGSTGPGAPGALLTHFFRATHDKPDAPTAQLNRYEGNGTSRYSAAHFHAVDQFQVIMEGSGDFGRHRVEPYYVHFSRAYTAYGPLQSDKHAGWAFLVLRSRYDPGAQRFPQALEKLKSIPNRTPWQVTTHVTFPECSDGVAVQDIPQIRDDQGLYTQTITMAPNARMMTPGRRGGDGQYVVVVKGSIVRAGIEKQAPTVVFINREEPPIELQAGPQGIECIVMNFPKANANHRDVKPATRAAYKTWQCLLCAFVYDEEAGLPEEGIAAGTQWVDVPETWSCPDCSATKADFQMIEI
jgi:rubredoxin